MRSNVYILSFMAGITIVLGFLLSFAATSLQGLQTFNIEIDKKKNILSSLNIPQDKTLQLTSEEIEQLFEDKITEIKVDADGIKTDGDGNYIYISTIDGKASGYSIPISGKGLWSTIYGYIALEADGETVKGIKFYQHGETPGLGGEIEKEWFTSNFVGKKIYNENGDMISIEIVKGHVNPKNVNANHQVDGISGSTLTGRGMNKFLKEDLNRYKPFLDRIRFGEVVI